MQKPIVFLAIFISLSFLFACGNKKAPKEKEPVKKENNAELSYESYLQLKKSKSVVFIISEMKNQGVGYVELPSDLSKYSLITDKNKMTMMFGMLSTNIAYEKILGNKPEMPGHMDLHLQFARKLNADPYLVAFFYTNLDRLKGNKIDNDLLKELESELDKYQVELVDRLKGVDDDFLVYYTLGVLTEMTYYKIYLTGTLSSGTDYDTMKDSYLAFVSNLFESEKYGEYARMFKPITDIILNTGNSNTISDEEKKKIILEAINKVRNKVFL